MTAEDHRLLKLWQERRDRGVPPELRLSETKEEWMAAFDNTMAMLTATDQVSSSTYRG